MKANTNRKPQLAVIDIDTKYMNFKGNKVKTKFKLYQDENCSYLIKVLFDDEVFDKYEETVGFVRIIQYADTKVNVFIAQIDGTAAVADDPIRAFYAAYTTKMEAMFWRMCGELPGDRKVRSFYGVNFEARKDGELISAQGSSLLNGA